MNKAYLLIVFLLIISCFAMPSKTFADTSCQPIYGGGQTCTTTNDIVINKTILNPKTNKFVDNLSVNDPRYQPGFITTFKIAVTNTGDSNISRINVKDIFPQYINFSSGPGNFDKNTKILSFNIDNLSVNETRSFTIVGRIVDSSLIPINQGGVVCVVNQATADNSDDNSQLSQDNAQLCIEKSTPISATKGGFPVLSAVPATKTPSTGAEAFALFALIPSGIAGLFLRKYSNKKEAGK
jgi:uncharacterized repeat protein (TIGR01451 family)